MRKNVGTWEYSAKIENIKRQIFAQERVSTLALGIQCENRKHKTANLCARTLALGNTVRK